MTVPYSEPMHNRLLLLRVVNCMYNIQNEGGILVERRELDQWVTDRENGGLEFRMCTHNAKITTSVFVPESELSFTVICLRK